MDKTIYRKYPDGEIIALFPEIAGGITGRCCQSYMHVGQHGAAIPHIVVGQTKPATIGESAALHAELERIGYNPKRAERFSPGDYEIRRKQYSIN